MISDDERLEVAARLRYVAEHGAPEWATIACCIAECLGKADYPLWRYGGEKLFDHLADLIEPEPERTCEIEFIGQDEFGIYDHLSCGHVAMRQWPEKTQYCPNCGARVVEVV